MFWIKLRHFIWQKIRFYKLSDKKTGNQIMEYSLFLNIRKTGVAFLADISFAL
jgi:hypothetical protein